MDGSSLTTDITPFYELDADGRVRLNLHPGQTRVYEADARIVCLLCGSQYGKTTMGPCWLHREMHEVDGSTPIFGDYLAVTATFPLLRLKMLPELQKFFTYYLKWGEWKAGEKVFESYLRNHGAPAQRIVIGSATSPESLESATAKAAWLDECLAPETLIETEVGQLFIKDIVDNRLPIRVWSYDGKWQLKPIMRWIKTPQNKPLRRIGPLHITDNHKVWTDTGYVESGIIGVALARKEAPVYVKTMRILRCNFDQEGTKEVLQYLLCGVSPGQSSGISKSNLRATDREVQGQRGKRSSIYQTERTIQESCQPSLVSADGECTPFFGTQKHGITSYQEKPGMDTWGQWPSFRPQAREIGTSFRLAQRICCCDSSDTSCLQDRRCGTQFENSDRSWQSCQSAQTGMVSEEWLDLSTFLQQDGGELDGRCSSDGFLYNLEVTDNHNYVANGILVANCGQHQFTREAWEAINRRLSISQGRILCTTTPYEFGWFKFEVYDRWVQGDMNIDVIQGDSKDNPAFPIEEYERQRTLLPRWKFNMFYRGRFEKPAGLIYDSFDEDVCCIPRFVLPSHWLRYVGHDFGPNNTAAVWYAQDPDTGYLYIYRTYHEGGLSAYDHAQKFKQLSANETVIKRVGGANHEDGWRESFTAAGWHISKPRERGVEIGINMVYGLHQQNKIFVFNDLQEYLDEKFAYSRKLDDNQEPTDKIEDKSRFHLMDSERYILSDFGPERAMQNLKVRVVHH